MGVVYRALDTRLKREVALKSLPPELASNPTRVARFKREAEAIAALNHPNIVTIYSVEESDGHQFLTMELVDGWTLDEIIPPEGLDSEKFLEIAVALAAAVAAAHERGIIHRDLKPANVMINRAGLVKILDFGLAKLFDPEPLTDADATRATVALTQIGQIAGTPSYMSPEQVKAGPVDHRSDIFSLGALLYQMATGRRAFRGGTAAEVTSAILRDEPENVRDLRPEQFPRHLNRIVSRCLEKDPESRFQSAEELQQQLVELRDERRAEELMAKSPLALRRGRLGKWTIPLVAVVAAALIVVIALSWGLYVRDRPTGQPAAAPAGVVSEPSLAVLPFQNLTGDVQLDWIRTGLPEMLITSLSQSPDLVVLTADRVRRVLGEGSPDAGPDKLRRLGEEGVSRVVTGRFAFLGEKFRVDLRIETAPAGDLVASVQAEGIGLDSLFSVADRLSRGVTDELNLSDEDSPAVTQALTEVTTASLEAYRYYTEGIRLRNEVKEPEAVPLFEKAIELDPGFAMAQQQLATIYQNLGDDRKARELSRRAFENSAQAPIQERYYIQGMYLGHDWVTYSRAVQPFQRLVEMFPRHDAGRRNLVFTLANLERYEEALDHARVLVSSRNLFGGNFYVASTLHAVLDQFPQGHQVLMDYLDRSQGIAYAHLLLGLHFVRWGKVQDALEALDEYRRLRPGTYEEAELRWFAYVQSDRWREGEEAARLMAESTHPQYESAGNVYLARSNLYRGRAAEALDRLSRASEAKSASAGLQAMAHATRADLLLQMDRPGDALTEATRAVEKGTGQWPQLYGRFLAAVAHTRLGNDVAARRLATRLEQRVQAQPNPAEARLSLLLGASLDGVAKDWDSASAKLIEAVAQLPPRGITTFFDPYYLPDHVPLWYALAWALHQAGKDKEAASWFERVVENRVESTHYAVLYGRSLYFLGEIYSKLGDEDKARDFYGRFADLWEQGELDRSRVQKAIRMSR